MASFVTRNGKTRALIRKGGQTLCATFATKTAAQAWAKQQEARIEQIRATGAIQDKNVTIADLIDRYIEQKGANWGRTKSRDLARLRKDLGKHRASTITTAQVVDYFMRRHREGAGQVVVSAQVGYLHGVLKTARTLWHLDLPVPAIQQAREALTEHKISGHSKERDRRVSTDELNALIKYFETGNKTTDLPMADIIRFCVATGMRISEVCRIQWVDFSEADKTVVIRDRKHPTDKVGNDQVVPLLNATGFDAFAIAKRQPRTDARIFPYNSRTVITYFPKAVKALRPTLAKFAVKREQPQLRGAKFDAAVQAKLDELVNDGELPEWANLHLHDLRHEAISRLFAAGYRIEQVALVSGHRSWAMLRRYTHVKATDLHRPSPEATEPPPSTKLRLVTSAKP
jgi:integrase